MKTILRIGRGVKVRQARVKEIFGSTSQGYGCGCVDGPDSSGLWHGKEILEQEVRGLPEERYTREGIGGNDRWERQ